MTLKFQNYSFVVEGKKITAQGLVKPGERVALLGPSGCGKSTFLKSLAGLAPCSGRLFIGEHEISQSEASARGCAFVFQRGGLFPQYDVLKNVALALKFRNETKDWSEALRAEKARELLQRLGLAALSSSRVEHLSGGEYKQILIARALLAKSLYVLLDEPFSGVDVFKRELLATWILENKDLLGVPLIFVTHDEAELSLMKAQRVVRWSQELDFGAS